MTRAARRSAAVAIALGLVVVACGADEPGEATGPTIADARFDGTFGVTSMVVDGNEQELVAPIAFDLDAEFGALMIETACGTLLGSFSLLDDGRAGVTIAGGSTRSCSTGEEEQRQELLAVLEGISGWTASDSGLELRTDRDDALRLAG